MSHPSQEDLVPHREIGIDDHIGAIGVSTCKGALIKFISTIPAVARSGPLSYPGLDLRRGFDHRSL